MCSQFSFDEIILRFSLLVARFRSTSARNYRDIEDDTQSILSAGQFWPVLCANKQFFITVPTTIGQSSRMSPYRETEPFRSRMTRGKSRVLADREVTCR